MITNELLEYVKGEHLRGVSLEKIKVTLLDNGWATADIEEAFNTLYKTAEAPKSEVAKVEMSKTIEKIEPKITEQVKTETVVSKPIGEIGINTIVEKKEEVKFKPEPIAGSFVEKNFTSNTATPILGIGESLGHANFPIQKNISNAAGSSLSLNMMQKPKNKLGKILFIIFLIIVAFGSAAATYGYYNGYFVSLPTVSAKALDLMSKASSVDYDITVSVDMSNVKKDKMVNILPGNIFSADNGKVTMKGAFDKSDTFNLKLNNAIDFSFGAISASLETRMVNNTFYAEVTKMPAISFLGDFSSFTNKWISIPMKSENTAIPTPSVSNFVGVDSSLLENFTPEQKADLAKITESASFIKITKKLAIEQITDGPAYHFSFTLDQEGIRSYLQNIKDYVQTAGKDNSAMSSFDPVKNYDEASKYIKDFNGEAWIGKNDGLLQKVSINIVSYVDPNVVDNGTGSVNIVAILRDWNKPVNVEVPAEAVNFQELISQSMEQGRIKAADDSVKSFVASIVPQAETYKEGNKNSYKGFCSLSMIKMTLNQFNSNSNDKSGAFCLDTKTKYIISAKLSTGIYSCVDTFGVAKETQKKPVGLVCE